MPTLSENSVSPTVPWKQMCFAANGAEGSSSTPEIREDKTFVVFRSNYTGALRDIAFRRLYELREQWSINPWIQGNTNCIPQFQESLEQFDVSSGRLFIDQTTLQLINDTSEAEPLREIIARNRSRIFSLERLDTAAQEVMFEAIFPGMLPPKNPSTCKNDTESVLPGWGLHDKAAESRFGQLITLLFSKMLAERSPEKIIIFAPHLLAHADWYFFDRHYDIAHEIGGNTTMGDVSIRFNAERAASDLFRFWISRAGFNAKDILIVDSPMAQLQMMESALSVESSPRFWVVADRHALVGSLTAWWRDAYKPIFSLSGTERFREFQARHAELSKGFFSLETVVKIVLPEFELIESLQNAGFEFISPEVLNAERIAEEINRKL